MGFGLVGKALSLNLPNPHISLSIQAPFLPPEEDKLPKEKPVDLSYPFDKVWDAALLVFQQARWNVTKANKGTGGLEVKVIMDLLTWTETFYLNLARIDDNATRVVMGRIGLSQPLDWGIAGQYIDSFLSKLESTLRSPK